MNKNEILNNFFKDEKIVSYDSTKIWTKTINKEKLVFKKTNKNKINNLNKIKKQILNRELNINNKKYKLVIPEIINWNKKNKLLCMEYCNGKNLEFILRNKSTHTKGVIYLNEILTFLIKNRIFWIDFAPRNILISKDKIYLVDFEKGIFPKKNTIYSYLRYHVYEEYCLFTLKNERIFDLDYVFKIRKNEIDVFYNINEIKSNRIKSIAQNLGYKNIITNKEYLDIWKILLVVEEPKIKNNQYIFPGVELDKIFNKKQNNLDIYVKEILKRYNDLKK